MENTYLLNTHPVIVVFFVVESTESCIRARVIKTDTVFHCDGLPPHRQLFKCLLIHFAWKAGTKSHLKH